MPEAGEQVYRALAWPECPDSSNPLSPCSDLKPPALPNPVIGLPAHGSDNLSPYPEPEEASGDGFSRDDLDKGQMLILGKNQ